MAMIDIVEQNFGIFFSFLMIVLLFFLVLIITNHLRKTKHEQKEEPEKITKIKKKESKKEPKKEVVVEVVDQKMRWLDLSKFGLWNKIKKKIVPDRLVLINMELVNGFHSTFLVLDHGEGFKYKRKFYIFDNELKYYHTTAKYYAYDYHEDLTLPIKRVVPVADIKKTVESLPQIEVEYAINPATLERFIVGKIAEGIMKGQKIDEVLRFVKLISIITLVAVLIHFILFAQKTGMLAAIKLPF